MKPFNEITPKELNSNIFKMIENDWMLITAEKEGLINSMTASCGGFGNMYPYQDVAFIFINPARYTNEFVQESDTFSLNFFSQQYRKQLSYFGSVSGRTENKVLKSGLTISHINSTPYYEEAQTIFICKKFFTQQLHGDHWVDQSVVQKLYPNKDYHIMYIGKIEKILIH